MLTAIFAFLQAVPSIVGGINAFAGKYYDSKVQIYSARVGGDLEAAKAMLAAEQQANATKVGWLQAVAGSPVLAFIVIGFAFPFIFYLNKVIVYDICLGLGSTPVLKYDQLAVWGDTILKGIFVTSGGVAAVTAWVNRKG